VIFKDEHGEYKVKEAAYLLRLVYSRDSDLSHFGDSLPGLAKLAHHLEVPAVHALVERHLKAAGEFLLPGGPCRCKSFAPLSPALQQMCDFVAVGSCANIEELVDSLLTAHSCNMWKLRSSCSRRLSEQLVEHASNGKLEMVPLKVGYHITP
jgi:hypothetical protein